MNRRCLTCHALIPRGSYCPGHKPATRWGNRDRGAQAKFRTALMKRAGGRCEGLVNGARCAATTDLRACHIIPLAKGGTYDVANGVLLCGTHDRMTDSYAR